MSAYLVDRKTIDQIVSAAIQLEVQVLIDGDFEKASISNADDLGAFLWNENLNSVKYRYPNDTSGNRPGPIGLYDAHIWNYAFDEVLFVQPLEIAAALDTYEYQSCEHPGWFQSESYENCGRIWRDLAKQLVRGTAAATV